MSRLILKDLEFFVKTHEFTDEPIQLSEAEIVTNPKKFAESHLAVLKANSGNKRMLPYYDRFVKFYKIVKNGNIN